jgi:hypothetical protein
MNIYFNKNNHHFDLKTNVQNWKNEETLCFKLAFIFRQHELDFFSNEKKSSAGQKIIFLYRRRRRRPKNMRDQF